MPDVWTPIAAMLERFERRTASYLTTVLVSSADALHSAQRCGRL
jgi:hypothetical protein